MPQESDYLSLQEQEAVTKALDNAASSSNLTPEQRAARAGPRRQMSEQQKQKQTMLKDMRKDLGKVKNLLESLEKKTVLMNMRDPEYMPKKIFKDVVQVQERLTATKTWCIEKIAAAELVSPEAATGVDDDWKSRISGDMKSFEELSVKLKELGM